jgi:hypothetical protein
LFPGRLGRGPVAILLPGSSRLWDVYPSDPRYDGSEMLYSAEQKYLHFALVHDGCTVDFVDETYIEQDVLTARAYKALYVIGPNVSIKAQHRINSWVQTGGTLAVTPGAGTVDEFNEPLPNEIDAVLGLKPRALSVRCLAEVEVWGVTDTLNTVNADFGQGTLDLIGTYKLESSPQMIREFPALEPFTAQAAGTLTQGNWPGITVNLYGTGFGIAYAFLPGLQYWQSTEHDDGGQEPSHGSRLPRNWGPGNASLPSRQRESRVLRSSWRSVSRWWKLADWIRPRAPRSCC